MRQFITFYGVYATGILSDAQEMRDEVDAELANLFGKGDFRGGSNGLGVAGFVFYADSDRQKAEAVFTFLNGKYPNKFFFHEAKSVKVRWTDEMIYDEHVKGYVPIYGYVE